MSEQDRTTVTRRRALQTGSLFLGAGLAAAGPIATVEAAPVASDLVAALCREPKPNTDAAFAAWLADWNRERQAARTARQRAEDAIAEYLPAEVRNQLLNTLSDAHCEEDCLQADHTRELFLRHLPGLEPVLRLVWQHAAQTYYGQEMECGATYCRDGY